MQRKAGFENREEEEEYITVHKRRKLETTPEVAIPEVAIPEVATLEWASLKYVAEKEAVAITNEKQTLLNITKCIEISAELWKKRQHQNAEKRQKFWTLAEGYIRNFPELTKQQEDEEEEQNVDRLCNGCTEAAAEMRSFFDQEAKYFRGYLTTLTIYIKGSPPPLLLPPCCCHCYSKLVNLYMEHYAIQCLFHKYGLVQRITKLPDTLCHLASLYLYNQSLSINLI